MRGIVPRPYSTTSGLPTHCTTLTHIHLCAEQRTSTSTELCVSWQKTLTFYLCLPKRFTSLSSFYGICPFPFSFFPLPFPYPDSDWLQLHIPWNASTVLPNPHDNRPLKNRSGKAKEGKPPPDRRSTMQPGQPVRPLFPILSFFVLCLSIMLIPPTYVFLCRVLSILTPDDLGFACDGFRALIKGAIGFGFNTLLLHSDRLSLVWMSVSR
ncbi:hypothetical protein B0T20DRAFT_231983 [Sordaria brevicollis]|uniref:Uncharacterized protein n=1 Tax=Sordaria brevicollis TaxID=83679 RepID=A0AAE0UB98_SORBR|nr:hypothetical protein B0T20DRAFT_231983 [Sordaria brevicollis]